MEVRRKKDIYHHSTQKKFPIIGARERIYPPEEIVSSRVMLVSLFSIIITSLISIERSERLNSTHFFTRV